MISISELPLISHIKNPLWIIITKGKDICFAETTKMERIIYSKFQQFNTVQNKVLRELAH